MEQTQLCDAVWEHKFRPTRLKDVILPQDYRNFFNKIIEAGASMNLILASSTPGSGKTTCARVIANELDAEFLFINASDENGIDTVRDKITGFASGMPSCSCRKEIPLFCRRLLSEPG